MARSVHTRPRSILAPARLRSPYAGHGATDRRRLYRDRRRLKEQGISVHESPGGISTSSEWLLRVIESGLPPGWCHPLCRAEIVAALRQLGPEVSYGLRSIELRDPPSAPGQLIFGQLVVPGRILLFAQPCAPWAIPGTLPSRDIDRMTRAGAVVEVVDSGVQTIVDWPGDSLRDFFLFDVLMHELGHHVIQQYTGKRRARVMRTKDHERIADLFVRRCREDFARR